MMDSKNFNSRAKRITQFYFFAMLTVIIFKYFNEVFNGGNNWKTADWLVNYEQGLVRRGLFGQVVLNISDSHIWITWATFTFQILCYIFIYSYVLRIFFHLKRIREEFVLLLSPAYILFPLYDLKGGFRKEILIFAIFIYLCHSLQVGYLSTKAQIFVMFAISLSELSHEAIIFTTGFLIFLFWRMKELKTLSSLRFLIIVTYLVFSATIIGIFSAVNSRLSPKFCALLQSEGFDKSMCTGAITALNTKLDLKYSFSRWHEFIPMYLALLIISLVPVAYFSKYIIQHKLKLGVSVCIVIPLFVIALDWGRWIAILIFMLFSILISDPEAKINNKKKIPIFLWFLYLISWGVPHMGIEVGNIGGLAQLIVHLFAVKGHISA